MEKLSEHALEQRVTELERQLRVRTVELAAALDGLRERERHYRMLFEANPHPMWVYDVETLNFLAVNGAALRQYGYSKQEFLDLTVLDIRPPDEREATQRVIAAQEWDRPRRGVSRHRTRSGAEIDVEVVSDGLQFQGRRARLVLASDITERRKAEQEVRRLNAVLEDRVRMRTAELVAANEELEAFSYSVSHDLRAPLRHIGGFVDLLQREAGAQLGATSARYLGIIRGAVQQMGKLIDDLLIFSRMARVDLLEERVDMRELVDEAVRSLEGTVDRARIEWTIGALPTVSGDRAMLRQVWLNLLGNALKYSRGRPVARIGIACQRLDDELQFTVEDNGAGFDMKYAGKLFGVFQRLHHQDEFEGTGIGLANVRRIVTRHGGRTWAHGRLDQGAAFHFSLPARREAG